MEYLNGEGKEKEKRKRTKKKRKKREEKINPNMVVLTKKNVLVFAKNILTKNILLKK